MPRGTVKWFNNAKGFGFILPDDGSGDLFVHYSSIEMEGYRTLKAGQTVTFEVNNGNKGMHACHIKPEQNQNTAHNPPIPSSYNPSTESSTKSTREFFPNNTNKVRDKSALEEAH